MSSLNQNNDTRPEAEAVLLQLIRAQQPATRLAKAVSASNRVAQQCKNAILRAAPEISEDEVKLRFIEFNYGEQLADEVRKYLAENR